MARTRPWLLEGLECPVLLESSQGLNLTLKLSLGYSRWETVACNSESGAGPESRI